MFLRNKMVLLTALHQHFSLFLQKIHQSAANLYSAPPPAALLLRRLHDRCALLDNFVLFLKNIIFETHRPLTPLSV